MACAPEDEMITYAEACEIAMRFCRIIHRRDDVLIQSSKEYDAHWIVNYGIPSLEDSSRIFLHASVVVEKQTGYLYYPPSRIPLPHRGYDDFQWVKQTFVEVTQEALDRMEARLRSHDQPLT
jgi:hypothetical protein